MPPPPSPHHHLTCGNKAGQLSCSPRRKPPDPQEKALGAGGGRGGRGDSERLISLHKAAQLGSREPEFEPHSSSAQTIIPSQLGCLLQKAGMDSTGWYTRPRLCLHLAWPLTHSHLRGPEVVWEPHPTSPRLGRQSSDDAKWLCDLPQVTRPLWTRSAPVHSMTSLPTFQGCRRGMHKMWYPAQSG